MEFRQTVKRNFQLLLLVFLAFLLMVLVSYFSISSMMRQQLESNAAQNLKIAEGTIETILIEPEVTMVNAVLTIQHMIENNEGKAALEDYLVSLTEWLILHEETVSGVNGLYGYIQGEYLDGLRWQPPEGYVAQERPWYIAAIEGDGNLALTSPYLDAETGGLVLSVAQVLRGADGEFLGVLALDTKVTRLVGYVREMKLSDEGYGILTDADMNIIAHPDDALLSTSILNVYPQFAAIADNETSEMSTLEWAGEDGRKDIVFVGRMDNGWMLAMVTPANDYYADISIMLLILSALGFTLMIILDVFLLRLSREKMRSERESISKSSFLANMSHEIRTPMNAIIGMSEIALREPGLPPRQMEYITGIRQAGANLLTLINDILDFSKIEAGKMEINEAPYVLSSLINDVLSIARARLAEKPVLLVSNIDCDVPNQLIGDELRIRQILQNILNNAVKYTEEGYVSFTVGCTHTEDGVALFSFEITDSGIGIQEKDIDKLFKDFAQVDTKRNQGVEGTGLGLAISYNLCRAMGGTIEVHSRYDEGTTFTILLPQKYVAYEPFARVENPEEMAVLVYEPRKMYANSIVCSIDNLGVDCTLVLSHSDFLAELEKKKFSHVFVSSFLHDSAQAILARLSIEAQLVVLAEFGEVSAEPGIRAIAMPVHAVSIANILNDVADSMIYNESGSGESCFIAPTARVLIVDDIQTNLVVSTGLLAPYQMMVDCASSGQEALGMVQRRPYDLVFMDHMMPEMDGMETTLAIRALKSDRQDFSTLPIVALTANAVTGMKEMFLSNGFDDFLAKPIETSQLYATLEKWIPKEKQEKCLAEQSAPAQGGISIRNLDTSLGLSLTGGNLDNYVRTLQIFCRDGHEKLEQLRENLRQNDLRLFTINVHALKSASASVGATELSERAKRLEAAGKQEDGAAIRRHSGTFFALLETVLSGIQDYLSQASRQEALSGAECGDTGGLAEMLAQLKESLQAFDIAASDDTLKRLQEKHWPPKIKEMLERIEQNILLFEYDAAIAMIDETLT